MELQICSSAIGFHVAGVLGVSESGYGRVINDGPIVAVARKLEIGQNVGTIEVQRIGVGPVRHSQDAVGIAVLHGVVVDVC